MIWFFGVWLSKGLPHDMMLHGQKRYFIRSIAIDDVGFLFDNIQINKHSCAQHDLPDTFILDINKSVCTITIANEQYLINEIPKVVDLCVSRGVCTRVHTKVLCVKEIYARIPVICK